MPLTADTAASPYAFSQEAYDSGAIAAGRPQSHPDTGTSGGIANPETTAAPRASHVRPISGEPESSFGASGAVAPQAPRKTPPSIPQWALPAAVVVAIAFLFLGIVLGKEAFFGSPIPKDEVPTMPPPPLATDAGVDDGQPTTPNTGIPLGDLVVVPPAGWSGGRVSDSVVELRGPAGQVLRVIYPFNGDRDDLRPRCGAISSEEQTPSLPEPVGPPPTSRSPGRAQPSPGADSSDYRITFRGVTFIGGMSADMEQGTLACGAEIVRFSDAVVMVERIGISYTGDESTFYSILPTLIGRR